MHRTLHGWPLLHYSHELAIPYGEVSYNRRPYLPAKSSQPPNTSLQPWTPAPHRTPALAGGARGCGEDTRTPAQTAGTGPSADPVGGRKVEGILPARMCESGEAVAQAAGQPWKITRIFDCPSQARGAARIPSGDATRSSRPFGGKRDPGDGGGQESRAVRQSTTTCARGHRRSRLMLDIVPQR
jgi:hypothetical protein